MDNELFWFEKLFPPSYTLSSKDFLIPSRNKNSDQNFINYINGYVKDFDVESIKNIYHRVYVILKALNEAKNAKSENFTTSFCESSTQTDFYECIWTSQELGILRREADIIKSENVKLKHKCEAFQQELLDKKSLYMGFDKSISNLRNDLVEANKSNQRLNILCENMKKNLTQLEHERTMYTNTIIRYSDTIENLKKLRNISNSRINNLEQEISHLKIEYSNELQLLKNQNYENLKEITNKLQIKLNEAYSLFEKSKSQLNLKNNEINKFRKSFEIMKLHLGYVQNKDTNCNLLNNIDYY